MNIIRNLQGADRISWINNKVMYYLNTNLPECNNPIQLSNGQLVPCGHCELCSGKLKKEWILRSRLELATAGKGMFLTLTFNDEHLADTSYKVVQNFIKRLRSFYERKVKQNISCKYFGVYEEGESTHRPHYHLLVFGYDVCDFLRNAKELFGFNGTANELLQTIWRQGFVYYEKMTTQNISYVCGYVQKKQFIENCCPILPSDSITRKDWRYINKYASNSREADFLLNYPEDKDLCRRRVFYFMSKGIGFTWLLNNVQKVVKKSYITTDGYKYAIPRAFRRKLKELFDIDILDKQDNIVNEEFFKFAIENAPNILDYSIKEFYDFLHKYVKFHFEQVEQKNNLLVSRRLLYEAKKKVKAR